MSGVDTELSEQAEVVYRRYEEARVFGFSEADALKFAESDIDVGELRRLARVGCPPEVGRTILF